MKYRVQVIFSKAYQVDVEAIDWRQAGRIAREVAHQETGFSTSEWDVEIENIEELKT